MMVVIHFNRKSKRLDCFGFLKFLHEGLILVGS